MDKDRTEKIELRKGRARAGDEAVFQCGRIVQINIVSANVVKKLMKTGRTKQP